MYIITQDDNKYIGTHGQQTYQLSIPRTGHLSCPEMYHFKAWFFLNIVCFACVLKFLCEQFYYRLNNKIDSTAEYLHQTSKSTFLRHSFFLSRAKRWGNRKILLECSWQEVSTNHHNVCPEWKLIRLAWKLEKYFS